MRIHCRLLSKALRKPWALLISLVLFLVVVEYRVMWKQLSTDSSLLPDTINGNDNGGGGSRRSKRLQELELLQEGYGFVGSNRFPNLPVSPRLQGLSWEPGGAAGGGGGGGSNARGALGDAGNRVAAADDDDDGNDRPRGDSAKEWGDGGGDGVIVGQWHVDHVRKLGIQPHNKWIVLDVTSGNCGSFSSIPSGWRILLTGNSSRPTGCRTPWCVSMLPQSIPGGDPSPLLGKTLAYLAAVSSGAQFILDADCTVPLKDAISVLRVSDKGKEHGLMHNGTRLFNPYAHFGDWSALPRAMAPGAGAGAGAGADKARPPNNSRLYYLRDFNNNVLVKHGLSEHSQDAYVVGSAGQTRRARFDPSTPPVYLGQSSFSPAVPASSLYRQKAFWALVLPCLSRGPRCQVLRQLITQRLFRELDAFGAYYRLTGVIGASDWTSQDASGSEMDASELYRLANFLDMWRCNGAWKFFVCLESLADDLMEEDWLITVHERSVLKAWVAVLRNTSGVVEPDRVQRPWRGVRRVSEIPATMGSMTSRLEHEGTKAEDFIRNNFVSVVAAAAATNCNATSTVCDLSKDKAAAEAVRRWFPVAQWRRPVIEDVVLVVVFNHDNFFLHNLPFLETMHRPFFKNIVYCVSNVEGFLNEKDSDLLRHVTLVEGMRDSWYLMYECLTSVARMNIQGVRGYLQIGDDTLLNTWRLFNASLDSVWMPFGFTTLKVDQPTHPWDWYWWPKSRGRPAVLKALSRIERLSGLSREELLNLDPGYNLTRGSPAAQRRPLATFTDTLTRDVAGFPPAPLPLDEFGRHEEPSQKVAAEFLKLYYGNRMAGMVKHRATDLFYIPHSVAPAFTGLSQLFLDHRVIVEIAVSVIHLGLSRVSKVNYVKGSSLWHRDRQSSYEHYDTSLTFLHPFKVKAEMTHKHSMGFYRDLYLKTLFTELSKRLHE